jgi:hypothetical protein
MEGDAMKRLITAVAVLFGLIASGNASLTISERTKVECLSSANEVWAAHNGAHATWHNIDGRKCWIVGYGKRKEVIQPETKPTFRPRQ